MRVIVAGSRTFDDYPTLERVMDRLTLKWGKNVVVISGHSGNVDRVTGRIIGADLLGEKWARARWHTIRVHRPDYEKYKKNPKFAPFARNEEMVADATHAAFFHDGSSPGTADCIERARKKGIKVKVILF
jgi:hypothetical protein